MKQSSKKKLCDCVEKSLRRYFADLNGEETSGVYQMVLAEIERPLLETVLKHVGENQSKAAKVLGINRNTLRKKLNLHGIAS